jgi:hypothetical protein
MKDRRKIVIVDNEDYQIGLTELGSLYFRVNGACLFLPKEEFKTLKEFLNEEQVKLKGVAWTSNFYKKLTVGALVTSEGAAKTSLRYGFKVYPCQILVSSSTYKALKKQIDNEK